MGNLFASLTTAAGTLESIQKALGVVQNNVSNASTPGYAKQRIHLESLPFDIVAGLPGGVAARELISTRSVYLEATVRQQNQRLGRFAQQADDLAQIEPVFDIGSQSGIAHAIDQFFQGVSQWSVTPNDAVARQGVIARAQAVAQSFQYASATLTRVLNGSRSQINDTVAAINQLAGRLAAYNAAVRTDYRVQGDPGLDAEVHVMLEELSGLVDFTAVRQSDGALTILAGGQIPLVIGDKSYAISADTSGAQAAIRDASGADVTGAIQDGRLRGHLDTLNSYIPTLAAELNTLAEAVADAVNAALAAGIDQNGQPGAPLFAYNAASGAAATIAVTPIAPEELAGALPPAPGGNGNILALAGLSTAPLVNGATFSGFYGAAAARAGRLLDGARRDETTQSLLLMQARAVRAEESAVSLDEEAVRLVELQRHYQAAARLFRAIDEMTEELIGILR
jgi:flagellar hook-associated protein 1 FlgK